MDPLTSPIVVPLNKGTLKTTHTTTASHLDSKCKNQDNCFGQSNPHILGRQCALIEEIGMTHGEDSMKLRELMSDMEKRDTKLAVEMGIKHAQP